MAGATIEISGHDAERQAAELQAALAAAAGPLDKVAPVEVERSATLVIAVIGLAFSGVGTAKTIWDWWQSRHSNGPTVRILLDDGSTVELAHIDEQQLRIEFERRTPRKDGPGGMP